MAVGFKPSSSVQSHEQSNKRRLFGVRPWRPSRWRSLLGTMPRLPSLPTLPPTTMTTSTVPLTSQVGGHAGVLTSEDGSLLIKPALPLELHFYQTLLSEPNFAPLVPFLPKFYGTLKLEGQVEGGAGGVVGGELRVTAVDASAKPEEKDEY